MSDLAMVLRYARKTGICYIQACNILHSSEVEHEGLFIDDDWLEKHDKFADVSDRFRYMDYVSECVTFRGLMHKVSYPRYLP